MISYNTIFGNVYEQKRGSMLSSKTIFRYVYEQPNIFTGNEYKHCHVDFFDMNAFTLEDKLLDVSKLKFGDIIEFKRKSGIHHCAIYKGDGMVIHKGMAPGESGFLSTKAKSNNGIGVRIDRIQDVEGDSPVCRNNMLDGIFPTSIEDISLRIEAAMKGETGYNLFYNNCQHFCTKIRYGYAFSRQADISGWNAYENKRVQVALVGDLKPKSNHMINKFVHQERFQCSDKGKSDENDFHHMIYNRTKTGFHDFSDLYVSTFVRETQIRSEIQQCIQNNTPSTDYSNITLTSQLSECKIFNIVPCRTRLSGSGSQLLYSMEYKYDNDTSYIVPCRTRLSGYGSQLHNYTPYNQQCIHKVLPIRSNTDYLNITLISQLSECKYDNDTRYTEPCLTLLSGSGSQLHNSSPSSDSNQLLFAILVIIFGSLGICIMISILLWYKSRERMSNINSAVSTIEPIHDGSN